MAYRFLQQFAANVEQVGDIEKRVQSVAEALTYPVGDQDSGEKARREALRRFLLPPSRDIGMFLYHCTSTESWMGLLQSSGRSLNNMGL